MEDNLTVLTGTNQNLPYERGKRLFSTRCSEAFEAILKANNEKCILWLLRYAVQSSEAKELANRIEKIKSLKISSLEILNYGNDNSGISYVLMKNEVLAPFMDSTWIPVELEQKFILALKIVETLHSSRIVLGDIADNSFLLAGESKKLILGSILGDFDFAAQNTALLPPPETINYVAPERKIANKADVYSDIYGLGVFAYRLFTGKYPEGTELPNRPSSYRSDLPSWVEPVVGMCLMADPTKRFKDISTMIRTIEESMRSGKVPELAGIWSVPVNQKQEDKKETKELVKAKPKQEKIAPTVADSKVDKKLEKPTSKSRVTLIWSFAVLMGIGIAGFLFLSISSTSKVEQTAPIKQVDKKEDLKSNDPIAFIAEYAPTELKDLILKLSDPQADLAKKLALLNEINKSQDSVAVEVLVSVIQSNYDINLKVEAKKYLISRLEQGSLPTVADFVKDWLNFQTTLSAASTHIFRAIDNTRPIRSRNASLIEAGAKDPVLAIRVSAALTLDEEDPSFLDSLRALLSKQMPNEDFSNRGIGALLISHPSLNVFLNHNLSDKLVKFSDNDLTWSMLKAAESDLPIIKDLAQEVIKRNILNSFQMVFMGVLVKDIEPGKISHVYDRELVLAALGKIQSSDLYNFARWDSVESEKVLTAICASSPDINVVKEAFDILAAKSLQNKLAANFISWIKSGFWEYRMRMAKSIAVLSLADLATPKDIELALDNLMPFSKGGLFKVLASSNDKSLIKEGLARMGPLLSEDDLLSLLLNANPEIRIEAVKSLKDRNELGVLREIVKAYDAEKDPEVRKVYNEYHWVTKNRKGF